MTWGRTLKKALKCKGLPVNFKEWRAIAEDRSECRSGDNGQGSGKKASKIQKKAPKKSFQESADVFTVFLPYFKHVFTSKEGIWELLQQIICPLGYILFVGELFWAFFLRNLQIKAPLFSRNPNHGRTRNLCLLPRIDPTGFMRAKMNIALRKRTLSPVRLVLEDSSKHSFMLFVVVSLQLGIII